ncbi:unnamed protein product [Nezara viridula]|uniref:Uncharacterized protein n=1 Tax=Nezara viridula TaxID=85310 RepID=A0A9P0HE94_NEZVI|nr:unnamed protein product [Nezara viridula]
MSQCLLDIHTDTYYFCRTPHQLPASSHSARWKRVVARRMIAHVRVGYLTARSCRSNKREETDNPARTCLSSHRAGWSQSRWFATDICPEAEQGYQ